MKKTKHFLGFLLLTVSFCMHAQIRYYASNRAQNAINTYQEDGTFIEEFIAQNSGGLSSPQDIVLHPDGFLLVTGTDNERIKKYDLETGAYLGDWSDTAFSLGRPSKMSIGPDNLLYVTQWGTTAPTAKIVRFDLDGNYLGPFTPIAPTGLGHLWDDNGNFYLAVFGVNTNEGDIRKYDTNGTFLEAFIDSSVLENPTYIWWGENNEMFVQDFTQGKVLHYDSDGNFLEDYITGLLNPEGYEFLPNGHLLVCERTGNQILEFDTNGTLVGRWDDGGTLASPNFIKALDLSTLKTQDFQQKSAFILPSLGVEFRVDTEALLGFDRLEVYDLVGKKIDSMLLQNQTIWNAQPFPDGMYFIVAKGQNKRERGQKIMVKH
ncbi:MAG TPA: T9SS type A sorting domain-containing protein [Flavobacteriaceae bacterium]|nr:T9SS type A sorting domain-containing protein [Flavobacteriaceae bacterium]MCB9212976.1 T9SS type A sorting domain-containing protein [Alteromonas sp.]HPF11352.1 T9SS type A sorting domain-containing protein [Flavobacteriaceae bacterium]HQU20515.1 T9SS type A sorting domain-containing protein [Flavobacteriaceae bacterium]HQU65852.1 T9SS type A sorting domain-containing protein [Flavobacteriaceae bacterium]